MDKQDFNKTTEESSNGSDIHDGGLSDNGNIIQPEPTNLDLLSSNEAVEPNKDDPPNISTLEEEAIAIPVSPNNLILKEEGKLSAVKVITRKRRNEEPASSISKRYKADQKLSPKKSIRRSLRISDRDSDSSQANNETQSISQKEESSDKEASKVQHPCRVPKNKKKAKSELLSKVRERRMSLRSSASGSESSASMNEVFRSKSRRIKGKKPQSIKSKEKVSHDDRKCTKITEKRQRSFASEKGSTEAKSSMRSNRRSKSMSTCDSNSDSSMKPVQLSKQKKERDVSPVSSESSVDNKRRRVKKATRLNPLTDDTETEDNAEQKTVVRYRRKKGNESTRIKTEFPMKTFLNSRISKLLDSDSNSDCDADEHRTSRNAELKSRLSIPDFNSKIDNSSRNNCLRSTDKGGTKVKSIVEKLSSVISKSKSIDPTYATPPIFEKRERLRTSAFKGKECSSDEDIQSNLEADSPEPSVSRGSSVVREGKSKPKTNACGRPRRSKLNMDEICKREFVQETLEPAIEKFVPYEEILLSIKASVPAKRMGRIDAKTKQEHEVKNEQSLKKLKALKYFRCGSCNCDISKHKWLQHFVEHGGIAWIDSFEPPIDLGDWNEALRRCINNFRIYKQIVMKCPNCQMEKKSALGHLSHLFICGESEESIEERMVSCELCEEKFLPFNSTQHKTKCSGARRLKLEEEQEKEVSSLDEDVSPADFSSSGRKKRQAVKQ